MPRNSSGTMSGANGPYTSGTTISSTAINARFADVESEITDSASRSGKGSFTAPIRGANGTVAAPTHSFTNDTGTGMYLAAAGDPRLSISGVDFITHDTITFPAGVSSVSTVKTSVANGQVNVVGNRDAANVNADVALGSTATRTAGFLLVIQNNVGAGGNKLLVDYNGLLTIGNPAAAIQPASMVTAITPNAGWGAFNGLGFWKDPCGTVYLKGFAQFSTGAGAAVFTLPAGFRPIAERTPLGLDTTAAGTVPVIVDIAATGVVSILGTTLVNAHFYSVDGVRFLAEQ